MQGTRSGGWLLLLAATLSAGCFSPPPEARARLEQVHQDGVTLDLAASGLEERLLGNQANLQLWQELQRRHAQVSALAIANQSAHFEDMVRTLDDQQEKARKLRHPGTDMASTGSAFPSAVAARPRARGRQNAAP